MSPPLQKFEAARKGLSCSQLLFSYCPSVSLDFSSPLVWLYGGIIHPNLTVVGCVCYVDFFFVSFLAITLNDAWLSATYLSFHLFLMTAAEALWRCLTCLQTIVSLWVAEGDPKKGLNPKKEFKNVCVWCGSRAVSGQPKAHVFLLVFQVTWPGDTDCGSQCLVAEGFLESLY